MTSVCRHGKWISQSVREKNEPWSWILTSWDQWKKNRLWQMSLSGVHVSVFCLLSSSCSRQFKVSYICSASGRTYISADFIKDHSRGPPLNHFDTAAKGHSLDMCSESIKSWNNDDNWQKNGYHDEAPVQKDDVGLQMSPRSNQTHPHD